MNTLLVLEDDPLDKLIIVHLLNQIGYVDIITTSSARQLKALIQEHNPVLLIMDVFYEGGKSIDLINDPLVNNLPILFVTISQEITIYEEIKENYRFGFLPKPLNPISLKSTINMLLNQQKLTIPSSSTENAFFLRQGNKQIRILYADILWLQADDNYTVIFTIHTKYAVKKPLKQTLAELDTRFVQCHKKYGVNLDFIATIKMKSILIQDLELPLSYTYKKEFMEKFQLLRGAKARSV